MGHNLCVPLLLTINLSPVERRSTICLVPLLRDVRGRGVNLLVQHMDVWARSVNVRSGMGVVVRSDMRLDVGLCDQVRFADSR